MDKLTSEKRSWNMSRIHGSNTRPELIVRSILHKMGYRFRLHDKKLPGKPDIVLPKYKAAIFVHGCFWHRHPECKYAYIPKSRTDFWNKKFEANIQRDKKNLLQLQEAGWLALIVWECEIKLNSINTLEKVSVILQQQITTLRVS
jgi:DNA mismatch endonuclease (patch repair protein)